MGTLATMPQTHLEYLRSCEEIWQQGMYVELHAYQHHVFMDWRFVDDERSRDIYVALNGAGVESMQAKWDEMFGVKEEEVKVKKPRKKDIGKKAIKKAGKTTAKKKSITPKNIKTTEKSYDKKSTSTKTKTKSKLLQSKL